MARREGELLLRGIVELDEGFVGGKRCRPASRGRRQPGKTMVAAGSVVQTEGWNGYADLGRVGYRQHPRTLPSAAAIDRWLPRSQIVLSNFKRWTLDSFHGVSPGHLRAYLGEYCYRLNRREQCADLFRRVLKRCVLSTDPAPSSLLTAT